MNFTSAAFFHRITAPKNSAKFIKKILTSSFSQKNSKINVVQNVTFRFVYQ